MTASVNSRAAAAIRRHARDLADQRFLMDVCGLIAPDGSIPPDDNRIYDVRELEATS
jgi:hypothetical protein